MEKLIVGFSYNRGILSRLIRFFTKSSVSHVFIVTWIHGEPMAYHAAGLSVGYSNLKYFSEYNTLVTCIELPVLAFDKAKIMRKAARLCGRPYGFKTLLGFGWVLLAKAIGLRVKNPWVDGSSTYICVELVGELAGVKDAESMTPDELLERMSKK